MIVVRSISPSLHVLSFKEHNRCVSSLVVKPGGAATHTHTHTQLSPVVEIELTAFAFCPKVLGTQTGSLVSPCLQQG